MSIFKHWIPSIYSSPLLLTCTWLYFALCSSLLVQLMGIRCLNQTQPTHHDNQSRDKPNMVMLVNIRRGAGKSVVGQVPCQLDLKRPRYERLKFCIATVLLPRPTPLKTLTKKRTNENLGALAAMNTVTRWVKTNTSLKSPCCRLHSLPTVLACNASRKENVTQHRHTMTWTTSLKSPCCGAHSLAMVLACCASSKENVTPHRHTMTWRTSLKPPRCGAHLAGHGPRTGLDWPGIGCFSRPVQ